WHAATGEGASPEDMAAAMKKVAEEDAKDAKTAAAKTAAKAGTDPMAKMKMAAPGAGPTAPAPGVRTELPSAYSSSGTTPITVKIPPDAQPVKIELKSKP